MPFVKDAIVNLSEPRGGRVSPLVAPCGTVRHKPTENISATPFSVDRVAIRVARASEGLLVD